MSGFQKGNKYAFKKGQSGNPAGRKLGDRNKFGEHFISDFYADWVQHGVAAIEQLRLDSPRDYVKVAASLLPREIIHKAAGIVDGWTEDEVRAGLELIRRQIAGAGAATAVAETASTPQSDSVH